MKIQKKEKPNTPAYEIPIYSHSELKELERELDANYRITKNLSTGQEVSFYNEEQYLKDKGALSENGAVIIQGDPITYKIERERLTQLYRLQAKREYAVRMDNKDMMEKVEGVANTMGVIY